MFSNCRPAGDQDYIEKFIVSLDVRPSSKETYRRQLKPFYEWVIAEKVEALSRELILKYRDYLKTKKRLAPFTIAGYLTALRRFLDWSEINGLAINVAKGIKGPKRGKGFKKDVLTLAQIKKLLSSVNTRDLAGKRDFAILNLMVRTGLRTIEIIRTNKEDLRQQAGVPILLVHGKGKDGKDDMVILTDSALTPIKDYLKARGKVLEDDPIFVSVSSKNFGLRLTTRSISRIVKERLRDINIDDPRITAHSLRHTAITLSLMAGATVQEARSMARHTDINTTMIYAHNIDRINNAPEKKIDEILK